MAWPKPELWYDVLGGENRQHNARLRQDQKLLEMRAATNVIPDPSGELVTRPGFSHVRATAITNTPAITWMSHLKDLADEFILGNSVTGGLNRDSANPPGAITGGAAFTTGQNVLLRSDIFNDLLIIVSNARNLPQTINSSVTRADLGGTPARGLDVKAFARRVCMFSPSDGTTTYRSIMSFTSVNDDQATWTTPYTVNMLNFGRIGTDANLLGGEHFQDHLMAFTEDAAFPVFATPNATLPLAFQTYAFKEEGGGPPNIQAVVPANDRLYWISRNYDVKEMLPNFQVRSIGWPVQPFLRGLSDSRRIYTIGGWEPQYRLVLWAVSDGSDTTNQDVLAYHVDTGIFTFHTLSINAFALRRVSGELRLIGGHYNGLFSNMFDTSTTGDLQTAASAIDADIQTARIHLGMPGVVKKCPYVAVEFDPIGSEVVTVQHQLDDTTTWTNFAESTLAMSGTDRRTKFFTIPAPFTEIGLRFRDANSGERFRVTRIGFPKPLAIYTSRD